MWGRGGADKPAFEQWKIFGLRIYQFGLKCNFLEYFTYCINASFLDLVWDYANLKSFVPLQDYILQTKMI